MMTGLLDMLNYGQMAHVPPRNALDGFAQALLWYLRGFTCRFPGWSVAAGVRLFANADSIEHTVKKGKVIPCVAR